MYIATWVAIVAVLFWAWGQYNCYRQVTVLRGCYLEMSDWAMKIAQDLDRVEHARGHHEGEWEALVRKHAVLQRRRGISLRKSWAEFEVRDEKV